MKKKLFLWVILLFMLGTFCSWAGTISMSGTQLTGGNFSNAEISGNGIQMHPNKTTVGGSWTALTDMTAEMRVTGIAEAYGRIYIVGGIDNAGANVDAVTRGDVSSISPVITWTTENVLPSAESSNPVFYYDSKIYSMDRTSGEIFAAAIDTATGALGEWTQMDDDAPSVGSLSGFVVFKGNLIVWGGSGETAWTAPIQPNGSIGTFVSLPDYPTLGGTMVMAPGKGLAGNYILSWGAYNGSTLDTNDAFSAVLSDDGTLSSWDANTAHANDGIWNITSGSFSAFGKVFCFNGQKYDSATFANMDESWESEVGASATLGTWTAGPATGFAGRQSGAVCIGDKVYVMGGQDSTAAIYHDDAKVLQLAGATGFARFGNWVSPVIDMSGAKYIQDITWTSGGTGTATVQYRVSETGASWGAWSAAASTSPISGGGTAAKYLQIAVNLTGDGAQQPTVQSFSVEYTEPLAAKSWEIYE
jgi:hypothetical protein